MNDLSRIAKALESIAESLVKMANPVLSFDENGNVRRASEEIDAAINEYRSPARTRAEEGR